MTLAPPMESPVQPDPFPNSVRRIGRRWWQWTVQSNLFQNRSRRRACRTEALRRRKEALISLKYEPRYLHPPQYCYGGRVGCYGKLKLPQPAGLSFLLSVAVYEHGDDAEQDEKQHDREGDETVARNALLVAHRTEAVHATGGQIGDEPRIAGGRPAEMVPEAIEERRQIVFTHAEFVELIGGGGFIGVSQWVYLFKNRLMRRLRRRRRGWFVRASDGRTVRNGGGTKFRRGHALKLRVELLDFRFERGNLVGEGARTVGNRINFFLRGRHTTISVPHQNGNQHAQRAQCNQHQRPGHRQTKFAQLAETGIGER